MRWWWRTRWPACPKDTGSCVSATVPSAMPPSVNCKGAHCMGKRWPSRLEHTVPGRRHRAHTTWTHHWRRTTLPCTFPGSPRTLMRTRCGGIRVCSWEHDVFSTSCSHLCLSFLPSLPPSLPPSFLPLFPFLLSFVSFHSFLSFSFLLFPLYSFFSLFSSFLFSLLFSSFFLLFSTLLSCCYHLCCWAAIRLHVLSCHLLEVHTKIRATANACTVAPLLHVFVLLLPVRLSAVPCELLCLCTCGCYEQLSIADQMLVLWPSPARFSSPWLTFAISFFLSVHLTIYSCISFLYSTRVSYSCISFLCLTSCILSFYHFIIFIVILCYYIIAVTAPVAMIIGGSVAILMCASTLVKWNDIQRSDPAADHNSQSDTSTPFHARIRNTHHRGHLHSTHHYSHVHNTQHHAYVHNTQCLWEVRRSALRQNPIQPQLCLLSVQDKARRHQSHRRAQKDEHRYLFSHFFSLSGAQRAALSAICCAAIMSFQVALSHYVYCPASTRTTLFLLAFFCATVHSLLRLASLSTITVSTLLCACTLSCIRALVCLKLVHSSLYFFVSDLHLLLTNVKSVYKQGGHMDDECAHEWVSEWMNEWMNEWTNEWTNV